MFGIAFSEPRYFSLQLITMEANVIDHFIDIDWIVQQSFGPVRSFASLVLRFRVVSYLLVKSRNFSVNRESGSWYWREAYLARWKNTLFTIDTV